MLFNDLYGRNQEHSQEPVKDTRLSDVYIRSNDLASDNSDNVTGGLFSILTPEPENGHKDDMPLSRKKKKKKRRYGRQM